MTCPETNQWTCVVQRKHRFSGAPFWEVMLGKVTWWTEQLIANGFLLPCVKQEPTWRLLEPSACIIGYNRTALTPEESNCSSVTLSRDPTLTTPCFHSSLHHKLTLWQADAWNLESQLTGNPSRLLAGWKGTWEEERTRLHHNSKNTLCRPHFENDLNTLGRKSKQFPLATSNDKPNHFGQFSI